MSHFADHARAYRALAAALRDQAARSPEFGGLILAQIADAHDAAADTIDAEVRAGILDHSCTIDHRTIPVPKCLACGAPRERA